MVYSGYTASYWRKKAGDRDSSPYYNYTGAIEDMVDGREEYYDQVSGYTIRQIEDALLGQRSWNGWKENIKPKICIRFIL